MALDDFPRCLRNLMAQSSIGEQMMVKDRIVRHLGNEHQVKSTLSLEFFRLSAKSVKAFKS